MAKITLEGLKVDVDEIKNQLKLLGVQAYQDKADDSKIEEVAVPDSANTEETTDEA